MSMDYINTEVGFSKARNPEHYQVHRKLLEKATQELAEKYGFAPLRTPYADYYATEDDCYLRNLGFELTPEIVTSDGKRDDLLLYLLHSIENATLLPIEDKAKAGKHLTFVVKPYKKAHRLSMAQETGAVADLVKKLKEEENQADVETLGLTEIVQLLDEANESFDELYGSRAGESLSRATSETMRTIRPKVDKAFKKMATAINALYQVNELVEKDPEKREELGALIKGINEILHQLQKNLSRAGVSSKPSHGPDEDEEEEETPTPEPVKPEITEVYSKVEDVHDPTGITRGKETIMKWVGDFELVNEAGDGPGKIIVKDNFTGVEEEVPAEDILSRSNTGCEFIMIRDFAEGDYKIRIETYDGGSPLVLEYPEVIKLV